MSSLPNAPLPPPSRATLLTGRAKWLWLSMAVALGVWLIILLATAAPRGERNAVREPVPQGPPRAGKANSEEFEAADAFSRRVDARQSRPLPSLPLRVDRGQGK